MNADLAKRIAKWEDFTSDWPSYGDMTGEQQRFVEDLIDALREAEKRPDVAALVKQCWPGLHTFSAFAILQSQAGDADEENWTHMAAFLRALAVEIGEMK